MPIVKRKEVSETQSEKLFQMMPFWVRKKRKAWLFGAALDYRSD